MIRKSIHRLVGIFMLVIVGAVFAELPEYLTFQVTPDGWTETVTCEFRKISLRTADFKMVGWKDPNLHDDMTNKDPYESYYMMTDKSKVPEVRTYRGQLREYPDIRVFMYVSPNNQGEMKALGDKCSIWRPLHYDLSDVLTDPVATAAFEFTLNTTNIVGAAADPELIQTNDSIAAGLPDYWKPKHCKPLGKMQVVPTGIEGDYGSVRSGTLARQEHELNMYDYQCARDGMVAHKTHVMTYREDPTKVFGKTDFGSSWFGSNFMMAKTNFVFSFRYGKGSGVANGKTAKGTGKASGAIHHEGNHTWGGDHQTYDPDVMGGGGPYWGPIIAEQCLAIRNKEALEKTGVLGVDKHMYDWDDDETYPGPPLPPFTLMDIGVTAVGQAVDIPVLENDYDSGGVPFALTDYASTNTMIGGTIQRLTNGVIRYTPPAGYYGRDMFPYEIMNTNGLVSKNLVFVEILNQDLAFHYTFDADQDGEAVDEGKMHNGKDASGTMEYTTGIFGKALVPEHGLIPSPKRLLSNDIVLHDKTVYKVMGSNYPQNYDATLETGNGFDPVAADYSLSFWFKQKGATTDVVLSLVSKIWTDVYLCGLQVSIEDKNLILNIGELDSTRGTQRIVWDHSEVKSGSWYHVVVNIDRKNDTAKLYVNGISASKQIKLLPDVMIFNGRAPLTFGKFALGQLAFDEIKLFTKARTRKEIKEEYDRGAATLPASVPEPETGRVGLSADGLDLTWGDDAGNAVSYNVYFGTDPDHLTLLTNTTQMVAQSGALGIGETYFWRVDSIHATETIPGEIWTFKTRFPRSVLAEDLVNWFNFEEANGPYMYDALSPRVGKVATPNITRRDGIVGKGLNFPDRKGVVDLGYDLTPESDDISFSLWVRKWEDDKTVIPLAFGDGYYMTYGRQARANLHNEEGRRARFLMPYRGRMGKRRINDFGWHHFVYVKTAETLTVYLDGKRMGTETFPGFEILTRGKGALGPHLGQLDEVMIWNRSLAAEDIDLLTMSYKDAVKLSYYDGVAQGDASAITNSVSYRNETPFRIDYSNNMSLFGGGKVGYGIVMESIFTPLVTGTYIFGLNTDNEGRLWINTNGVGAAESNLTQVALAEEPTRERDLLGDYAELELVAGKDYYLKALVNVQKAKDGYFTSEFFYQGPEELELIDFKKVRNTPISYPYLSSIDKKEGENTAPERLFRVVKKTWRAPVVGTNTYTQSLNYNIYDPDRLESLTFVKKKAEIFPWITVNSDGTIEGRISAADVRDLPYKLPIQVTDSKGESLGFRLDLTIIPNTPPAWTTNTVSFRPAINRVSSLDLEDYVIDSDEGDTLTFLASKSKFYTLNSEGLMTSKTMKSPVESQFVVTAADASGDEAAVTIDLQYQPANEAPRWRSSQLVLPEASFGLAYRLDLKPVVVDPEQDPLSFRLEEGPDWVKCSPDGILSGVPVPVEVDEYAVEESFVLTVSCNDGFGSVSVQLELDITEAGFDGSIGTIVVPNGINQAPIGVVDRFSVEEDQSLVIKVADLLSNDVDFEGDALSFVSLPTGPTGLGNLAQDGNGDLLYQPLSDQYGLDTFTYVIQDSAGLSSEGRVDITITPVNDQPVAKDVYVNWTKEESKELWIKRSMSDVETATMNLSIKFPKTSDQGFFELAPTSKSRFTIVCKRVQSSFSGVDTFTYTVTDSDGGSAQATVYLNLTGSPIGNQDDDKNGMADLWETENNVSDPLADPDKDGWNNIGEYIAGTNPNDPTSLLSLILSPQTSGAIVLNWDAVSNRTYSVYVAKRLDMGNQFELLHEGLDAPIHTYTNVLHLPDSQRFYKLGVEKVK